MYAGTGYIFIDQVHLTELDRHIQCQRYIIRRRNGQYDASGDMSVDEIHITELTAFEDGMRRYS